VCDAARQDAEALEPLDVQHVPVARLLFRPEAPGRHPIRRAVADLRQEPHGSGHSRQGVRDRDRDDARPDDAVMIDGGRPGTSCLHRTPSRWTTRVLERDESAVVSAAVADSCRPTYRLIRDPRSKFVFAISDL
jgi:hypothetical protein